MIYYVVTEAGRFGIEDSFLDRGGAVIRERFRVITYEELPTLDSLPNGTWVFTAMDRLTVAAHRVAELAWEGLESAGGMRLLNCPARTMSRAGLLDALHTAGVNDFRAFTIGAALSERLRFPVFIRHASDHTGSLTPLLGSRGRLRTALVRLLLLGYRREDLLVVEFSDTSDAAGVFRKYSVFVVGDRIIPRHLMLSPEWQTKVSFGGWTAAVAEEELGFVRANPHADFLLDICRTARIEYGRVDYALRAGRPLVWEINTNPTIGLIPGVIWPPEEVRRLRSRAFELFDERFCEAWVTIDAPPSGPPVPFDLPAALVDRVATAERVTARQETRRRLARAVVSVPAALVRPARRFARRHLARESAS